MFAITNQAYSPIRRAFYETFKILHIILAALAVIALWKHLTLQGFTGDGQVVGVVFLWTMDRCIRAFRILYRNIRQSRTRTVVEGLPGNTCRITMNLARPWRARPGQHAYMNSVGLSQSHPFTVAWNENLKDMATDKLDEKWDDFEPRDISQICFLLRARAGFTNRLYEKALAAPGGRMEVAVAEGPYGVSHSLDSYGSIVLVAGGVGITRQVPYVKSLVAGFNEGTVAARKILLVWAVKSSSHLEWVRPWMTEILGMEGRGDVLRIMLFISQPRSSQEIQSSSKTVQMFPGRPNMDSFAGFGAGESDCIYGRHRVRSWCSQ